ncbi:MAG: YihY/virulence factor BrkB family protein [Lachnospiraceae bacterium]|nr:YihY/virulence factor BrkB family protein [Lachnospiraceae bacterium]
MIRKLFCIGRNFARQLARDNVNSYAASIAFFIFLSIIPMLMLLCAVLPYTNLTEADLMRALVEFVPSSMDSFIVNQVAYVYDKSPGVLSISAIVTVWSAAKGVLALMRGLNAVNGVVVERGYVRQRLEACVYTVIMLAAVVLSLGFMVFGNVIRDFLLQHFPAIGIVFKVLARFRFLMTWAVLTVVFTLLYTWIPNKKMRLKMQIPGAVFVAVAWSIFSYGFSVYVDHYEGLSMYGSMTTIIIVMLWLYCCMYIVMIGANMNRYFKPAYKVFMEKDEA